MCKKKSNTHLTQDFSKTLILEPASGRVNYFLLRAYAGTSVSHSQHRIKSGEVLEKNAGERTGRVEINQEEIPGSKRSMHIYKLTYSRL